jgi:hypothetical protein
MKKYILPSCAPISVLIYVIFRIANHYMVVSDSVAEPAFIISVALMFIGTVYNGWCWGKRISRSGIGKVKKAEDQST